MNNQELLKRRIMWRVHTIYCFRCAMNPLAHQIGFLAVLAVATSLVSVKNIILNALIIGDSPLALMRFFLDAVVNTDITVQILSLLVVGFFLILIYDLVEHFSFLNRRGVI